MTHIEELRPCPFCGASCVRMGLNVLGKAWVVCENCSAFGPVEKLESKATTAWNRRARSAGEDAALLQDPVAVHVNMLRGTIAKPSIENIIHLYGREALVEALGSAGEGETVRALTWEPSGERGVSYRATFIGLRYYVYISSYDGRWHAYIEGYEPKVLGDFGVLKEAKAAAQNNFNARIMSALSSHPAAMGGETREALEALAAELERQSQRHANDVDSDCEPHWSSQQELAVWGNAVRAVLGLLTAPRDAGEEPPEDCSCKKCREARSPSPPMTTEKETP